MKVLYILADTDEDNNGLLVLDICRNARQFGIEPFVTILGHSDVELDLRNSGAEVFRYDFGSELDLNFVFRLRKLIRHLEIEVIHSFGASEAILSGVATFGSRSLKRVLSHPTGKPGGQRKTGRLTRKNLSKRIDAHLVPTRRAYATMRAAGFNTAGNFYLVPPGVDKKRFDVVKSDLRSDLGITDRDFLIGMIAPFDSFSGIDQKTVCKAMSVVLENHPEACLVFGGNICEGSEDAFEDCVEFCDVAGIGDRVFFAVEGFRREEMFHTLDLFVYSAVREFAPFSVVEAMIAGKPMIVSDTDSLVELTDAGRCANVFVRFDEEELADKIGSMISNKKLRERKAVESGKYGESRFLVESHLRAISTLYSELVLQEEVISLEDPDDKKTEDIDDGESSVLGLTDEI